MYPFVLVGGAMTLYFLVAVVKRPRPGEFLAFVLWAAYSVYEYYVANGTLCDAQCNIRVDLVLFLPILVTATVLGVQDQPRVGAIATLYVVCLGLIAGLASLFNHTAVSAAAGVGALVAAAYGIKSAVAGRGAERR